MFLNMKQNIINSIKIQKIQLILEIPFLLGLEIKTI